MGTVFTVQHMCYSRALISPYISNNGPADNAFVKGDNAPEVERINAAFQSRCALSIMQFDQGGPL